MEKKLKSNDVAAAASSSSAAATTEAPSPPWLYLPDALTELILERLPLSDYFRFALVCKKWRSIQSFHRRSHCPVLPLPWTITSGCDYSFKAPLFCFSPFEDHRYYHPKNLAFLHGCTFLSSSYGRVLLLRNGSCLLFNPITGAQTPLPSLPLLPQLESKYQIVAAMSPFLQQCSVLIKVDTKLYLFRTGDPGWTHLPFSDAITMFSAVYCVGKFYCYMANWLLVLDPLPAVPTFEAFDMDMSNLLLVVDPLPTVPAFEVFDMDSDLLIGKVDEFLVECNGEVLLVEVELKEVESKVYDVKSFRVYRADIFEKIWVLMERLGDWVLFLGQNSSFSLLASDVGGKRNCIYFCGYSLCGAAIMWREFDLETGKVTNVHACLPNAVVECDDILPRPLCWIVPSLEDVSRAIVRD